MKRQIHPRILSMGFILSMGLIFAFVAGCTAVQRVSDAPSARVGYLRLNVEPVATRIYVDSEYRGLVQGWAAQTLVLQPGTRRVELRADGFMTRRFDIEVEADEQLMLDLRMEPDLEQLD